MHQGNIYCGEIFDIIAQHASTKVAPLGTSVKIDTCLIFDEITLKSGQALDTPDILNFCGVSGYFRFDYRLSMKISILFC